MEGLVRPLTARSRFALRAALLVAWASGVGGAATSCWTLGYYRNPIPIRGASTVDATVPAADGSSSSPRGTPASAAAASTSAAASPSTVPAPSASVDVPGLALPAPVASSAAVSTPTISPQAELVIDVLERHRQTRLPLAIADLLLSFALVIGVARTFGRRAGGKAWLQQVCVAVLVYALVEHALTRDERRDFAEGMLDFEIQKLEPAKRPTADERVRLLGLWTQSTRVGLLLELALFGGLAYALSRPSVILELAPRELGRTPRSPEDDDE